MRLGSEALAQDVADEEAEEFLNGRVSEFSRELEGALAQAGIEQFCLLEGPEPFIDLAHTVDDRRRVLLQMPFVSQCRKFLCPPGFDGEGLQNRRATAAARRPA